MESEIRQFHLIPLFSFGPSYFNVTANMTVRAPLHTFTVSNLKSLIINFAWLFIVRRLYVDFWSYDAVYVWCFVRDDFPIGLGNLGKHARNLHMEGEGLECRPPGTGHDSAAAHLRVSLSPSPLFHPLIL
jgi:hypothetical protein